MNLPSVRMLRAWIASCMLLQGANCFTVQDVQHNRCLQTSLEDHSLQLGQCNLNSELQQWFWSKQHFLVNKATIKCLSAQQANLVQTASCDSSDALQWQCHQRRLMARGVGQGLSSDGSRLFLTSNNKERAKWSSIEGLDICKEMIRSKRASEGSELNGSPEPEMTEAQAEREYLAWLYRTEDSSPWKYSMLGLSFFALLLGALLLGKGIMGNRNRKKTATYKAAAQPAKADELHSLNEIKQPFSSSHEHKISLSSANSQSTPPKAGEILITWKDGKTSQMYADPHEETV
ncbi:uncharacterized protein LOC136748086 [Amia ocellicauda]|uniref:uncharacterized protein LOC136748086 n=1 Tax=Amia ocellicauda TaxID=2972642 RepID=UPI0034643371